MRTRRTTRSVGWDWLDIGSRGQDLREFTRRLIAVRKSYPVLSRGRFVVGTYNQSLDVKDVSWLSPTGNEMSQEQWNDENAKCFGMLLDGRAQESGIIQRGEDSTVLLVYNAHFDVVNFELPSVPEGDRWETLIDTNAPSVRSVRHPFGEIYAVTARSMIAFGLVPQAR